MKVGLLTSGGDCPGMNTFLNRFVNECEKYKIKTFAIMKGYQGLIDGEIVKLEKKDVKNIAHIGGSVIKSFRSEEFKTDKGFLKALENIRKFKLDCIIAVGGDGTLKGVDKLCQSGVNVIFIPGTIDNDLNYTEKTLGFDSAINTAIEAIDKIHQTMLSANRGILVEVMGRDCGDIALFSALAVNADYLITKERMFDYNAVKKEMKQLIESGVETPVIIVQEHCIDISECAKMLQNDLDIEFRADRLGYIQRGGAPSVYDRIYALELAVSAIDLLKSKKFNVALGILNSEIIKVEIKDVFQKKNKKDASLFKFLK